MGFADRTLPRRGARGDTRERVRARPESPGARSGHGRRIGVAAATNILKRERHQPDWSILVAVVALAAIGILMVYSSSAMRSYIQNDDSLAIVGPQILWASLGLIAMVVMMRDRKSVV